MIAKRCLHIISNDHKPYVYKKKQIQEISVNNEKSWPN